MKRKSKSKNNFKKPSFTQKQQWKKLAISSLAALLVLYCFDFFKTSIIVREVRKDVPDFQDPCKHMMVHGHWEQFFYPQSYYERLKKFEENGLEGGAPHDQLIDDNGNWLYGGIFKPDVCTLHQYTTDDIKSCLGMQARPIYVIGDSRARLIYRVIGAKGLGQESLEDTKVHNDLSSDIGVPIKYFWSQSFDGDHDQVSHHVSMIHEAMGKHAQMIIVGEQHLHPVEAAWDRNDRDYQKIFYKALSHAYKEIFPLLNSFASEGNTVIVMAAENATRSYKGGEEAQQFWTDSTNYYNEMLGTMLAKKFKNIKFMYNNMRTTRGPNYEPLLPDNTHKLEKGGSQIIPPALSADLDTILNAHCNPRINPSDSTCCRNG